MKMTPHRFSPFSPENIERLQNYYNTKGLLSADKSVRKLAFYELQRFYQGLG
jgi:hypothetical protein